MKNSSIFDSKVFVRPTFTKPPSDAVEYYTLSKANYDYIYFNKEQLLLMYHLLRFGYFDREIINTIYHSLTHSNLLQTWLQRCIGNRNHPLSAHDIRDGRKKIYYVNTIFAKWLLSVLNNHPDIIALCSVTEYDYSMYSVSSNKLFGGKPKAVNAHDLNTRRYCARVAKELSERCEHLTYQQLNIQYSFPTNRQAITLLPDAAFFVQGKCFYFEYDRNTEVHFQLLGKIIAYFSEEYYRGATVFFIFDNISRPKGSDSSLFHPRVNRFLKNIETIAFNDGDKTYYDKLQEHEVSILASGFQLATSQIAYHICSTLDILPESDKDISGKLLSGESGLPYEVTRVAQVESYEPFELYITIQNDSFEEEVIPLIKSSYAPAGLAIELDELYCQYKDKYNHIVIVFDKKVDAQFYPLPHVPYFIPLFL